MRLMVGGRTCSASASSPSDLGPPKTRTESAESWAGPTPLSRSRMRSRRSKWMAAEWSWSAMSIVDGCATGVNEAARAAFGKVSARAPGEAIGFFKPGVFLRLTGAMEDS